MVAALSRLALARAALTEASRAQGLVLPVSPHVPAGPRQPTGLAPLDALLRGGLPTGRLTELVGERSSGRLTLALGVLSHAARRGHTVAWLDGADALEPACVPPEVRPRFLWVRAGSVRTALQCAELALDAGSFSTLALYLVAAPLGGPTLAASAWQRLATRAARARAVLLVVRDERALWGPGGAAWLTLQVRRERVQLRQGLLPEQLGSEVSIVRARAGLPLGASAPLRFDVA